MRALALLMVAALFIAGCGKKPEHTKVKEETAATPSTTETAPSASPETQNYQAPPSENLDIVQRAQRLEATDSQAPPIQMRDINDIMPGQVHPIYTSMLRQFVQKNKRIPTHFAELVNSEMDSVPSAPKGKSYAIDEKTLTVKMVKN